MPRVKSKNYAERKQQSADVLIGIMLFIAAGIMPLVVRAALRPTPPELWDILMQEERADAFAYWRSWFLMIPALVIAFYFVSDLVTGGFRDAVDFKSLIKRPPIIALGIYLLFVLLSNIFSKYHYTALWGTIDRFEGTFVQLAYLVIFVTVLFFARNEKYAKIVLCPLIFSSLIMGAIGVSQTFRHDFYGTDFGKSLILGEAKGATVVFASAYGSLFNPNTYGLYSAMMAPFLLICGFSYPRNPLVKVLSIAAGIMMGIGIVGSRSMGGALGAAAAVAVLIITYVTYLVCAKKRPPWVLLIIIPSLLAVGALIYHFTPVRDLAKGVVNKINAMLKFESTSPVDYAFSGDTLTVSEDGRTLYSMTAEPDGWMTMLDGNGIQVEPAVGDPSENGTIYTYEIPDYGGLRITRSTNYFTFDRMNFTIANGEIVPLSLSGQPIDVKTPIPSMGFKGHESFGSDRGYIWSRSFPLMLDHILLGSGSDSFINEFPQNDIVGKRRFLSFPYTVVDKAHNLYVQTAVTTGGISMLALMFLIGFYWITTFISLIKSRDESRFSFGIRIGLLCAVTAFAVSSMGTDSTIPSTGVFWILLGLGYALNAWDKLERNKTYKEATNGNSN